MSDPAQTTTGTCTYHCIDGEWVLIGGTVSPGYVCPEIGGDCNNPGTVVQTRPIPIEPPDPPALHSLSSAGVPLGTYRYDRATESFYFSNGSRVDGFGFVNKLSLEECISLYPELAGTLKALQSIPDLSCISLDLPSLPFQQIASWNKSKSSEGLT